MAARRSTDVRGRVVLRMRGGSASPLAMQTAVRVAHAFQGELHGLFVEDEELLALAGLPFAREISFTGRRSRQLSLDVVRAEMRAAIAAMEREFERLTRAARVPMRFDVFRGAAEDELHRALKEAGILAIGEPLALTGSHLVREMLAELTGLAGLVLVGAEARRARGAVVALIDPGADVAMLVDSAERLAGEGAEEVVLLLATPDTGEAARLEREARAALDPGTRYRFERLADPTARAAREAARRGGAGLVIARLGGPLAPDIPTAARTACAIECPLLLLSAGAESGTAPPGGEQ